MEFRRLKLADLEVNDGRIPGLPRNPREWTRAQVAKLKQSISETPELLEARGVIVYPYNGRYVVIGGNMRLAALKALKAEDAPCIILPADTDVSKLKEIAVKDNSSFGEWDYDALANEWDDAPLVGWGVPAWDCDGEEVRGGADAGEPGEVSMILKFSQDEFDFVCSRLGEIRPLKEEALLTILNYGNGK